MQRMMVPALSGRQRTGASLSMSVLMALSRSADAARWDSLRDPVR